MTKSRMRCINGIEPDNWNQFTMWAKRLGLKQSEFFTELMKYYFEGNRDKIEQMMNISLKVATRDDKDVSPMLMADIRKVEQQIAMMAPDQLKKEARKLAAIYVDNKMYARADRMKAEEAIVHFEQVAEEKEKKAKETPPKTDDEEVDEILTAKPKAKE